MTDRPNPDRPQDIPIRRCFACAAELEPTVQNCPRCGCRQPAQALPEVPFSRRPRRTDR